ncbi:hypothetical protein HHI36_022189 [Cryptolaemus montrouzieri]|uniref:AD domain-containing protein n=1 Tax=Cryptolaemus montrouzieri TaxID=559131 RepID=A0ABD2MZ60_9CUCU
METENSVSFDTCFGVKNTNVTKRRCQCDFSGVMAAVSDCFSLGSIVWCRTCYDTEVEGEVLAFDANTKILILKCSSSNGDAKLNDVHFINLSLLNTRVKNQVDEKKRLLQAKSTNASSEGQSVFIAIAKTIDEVRWRNSEIVVWNHEVVISPPYQLENIRGDPNNKGYGYIKKVVEKHWNDLALNSQNNSQNIVQSNSNANYK